jgi:uncharacterized protein with GYD domain
MPAFLFQGSYTSQSIAALIEKPEDRSVLVRSIIDKLGGRMECFYLAFGKHDFFVVAQLPDDQAAAAFALAAAAGGGLHNFQTIPLLSWSDGINAMKQAAKAGYRPPGGRPA